MRVLDLPYEIHHLIKNSSPAETRARYSIYVDECSNDSVIHEGRRVDLGGFLVDSVAQPALQP
ncbi:hypothetical protein BD626DRAFT_529341 [Schizophyllum amplum]|uniref:Uncharacterized protein n=1 Tax=Schizophyllum amplum TaxID=97359 RepID=A0A550BRV9_9AGAR|nr:hypothetical protein BD626DRAFT_529341 [Auriculariopsis ampla]